VSFAAWLGLIVAPANIKTPAAARATFDHRAARLVITLLAPAYARRSLSPEDSSSKA
jgi:hypothetical protein